MLLISNCDGPSCGDEDFGNSFREAQLGQLSNALVIKAGSFLYQPFQWDNVPEFLISGKVQDAKNKYLKEYNEF